MNKPTPEDKGFMTSEEALEFDKLQSALCDLLIRKRITNPSQLDPRLIEPARLHLMICKTKRHEAVIGLYDGDE